MILGRINRRNRIVAALSAATVYALCVLVPNVALALSNGKGAAHCLTEPMVMAPVAKTTLHKHADGSTHEHKTYKEAAANTAPQDEANTAHGKPDSEKETNCCGLFCVTALNRDGVATLPTPPSPDSVAAVFQPERRSLSPLRIYEPPIT